MLLRWKKENLNVIPLIATSEETQKISLKRNYVTLLTGINEIRDSEYSVIRPHIKRDIELKNLEILHEKTQSMPGKKQKNANSLKDIPYKRAIELVKETFSPETLNLWLAIETRESVLKAVNLRMDELELKREVPAPETVEDYTDSDLEMDDDEKDEKKD
jgi:hypothetical protein